MTKKERLLRSLDFERTDRIPLLGGFIVNADHYIDIAGVTEEAFFTDPKRYAIEVYRQLDPDALILLRLPPGREGHERYRGMTREKFEEHTETFRSPEDVLRHVEALASPDEALASFDAEAWKAEFTGDLTAMQRDLGDIVWIPTQWDRVHPSFELYTVFGYENYLQFMGLYPDAAGRLFGSHVEVHRAISQIVVDVYTELDMVPLVHIGSDICGRDGPVVSPDFLRKHYFPHVERSLEPLVEAGFKTVWHCDGVVGPILDDLLDCGVSGFQGFQWEYGVRLEDIVQKRTRDGDRLTIFAGPSSSSTLPFGSIDDVRREVEYIIDIGRDACALFILPANDVLADTPTENLVEMYRYAAEYGAR